MLRNRSIWARLLQGFRGDLTPEPQSDAPCTHVVLLDGTMSSLNPGCETNIGQTYNLLAELPPEAGVHVHYEPGIQWRGLRHAHEVMAGIGINRQIRRAYRFLVKGYKPGDRIVLMGYSRGAYAVRSLAGLIDRMGLMRRAHLNDDTLEELYTLYREAPGSPRAAYLTDQWCDRDVPITFLGVYDTVRALGMRWPVVWRILPPPHPYHNHALGAGVEVARQALAMDETRVAYAPVLWDTTYAGPGQDVVQMWFRGSHGDIGGQIDMRFAVRPRANISLRWMLDEAETCGLTLPEGWAARFEMDVDAPSVGTFRRFGKLFWARRKRRIGHDASEVIHNTAQDWAEARGVVAPSESAGIAPAAPSPGAAR
ncbi:DUF2235 domain-containing protein [Gymnodinialimonas sp. 2305UL16-5]|uniref:DUF2235 domain-containing protein n=1 Tax=Gymnodinialimonas mytili TaxID=3126503 RepID=UPI0030AD3CC9